MLLKKKCEVVISLRGGVLPAASMALRAITLLSRFSLLFLAAKALTPYEFGFFGLFAALVVFFQYVAGAEFYVYSARTLLGQRKIYVSDVLLSHGVFLFCTALTICVFYVVFMLFFADNGWSSVGYFLIPIFLFELVGQECGRLLVVLGKPFGAGVVMFFRSGIWAILMSVLLFFFPDDIGLKDLLLAWMLGGLVAATLSLILIKEKLFAGGARRFLGWHWVWLGVGTSLPYWLSSLSLKAIGTLDRFLFEDFVGSYVLAAFVLYAGIAGAIGSFLDAGVFSYLYPKVMSAWESGDSDVFKSLLRKMLFSAFVFSILSSIFILLVFPYIQLFIRNDVYFEYMGILLFLLLSQVVFSLSMVAHFALYAQRLDRAVFACHVSMLPLFFCSVYVVSFYSSIYAVPAGVFFAFLFLMLAKWAVYFKKTPSKFRLI